MWEIEHALANLKSNKSPGPDNLPGEMIKLLYKLNSHLFTNLFNKIWSSKKFPDSWKIANVALIPKEGKDLKLIDSYRPICLLPIWGKVLDKILNNRFIAYLEDNNILDKRQYGFRRGKSTINALEVVKKYIDSKVTNNEIVCMISLDIKNAFNSIRTNDLFEIMDNYHVPVGLKLIISDYLTNRKIKLLDEDYLDYNIGVPQGSCLGPTLWLLVISELLLKTKNKYYELLCYADDIVILLSASACYIFTDSSKEPLLEVSNWCDSFGLTLSIHKCIFTLFKHGKKISHIPRIKLNNTSLKYSNTLKYLGIILDNNRTFIPHMNDLKLRIDNISHRIRNITRAT